MLHAEFKDLVRKNWCTDARVEMSLELFKNVIQEWNERVYRNIFVRMRKLVSELNRMQKILDLRQSTRL